MEKEIFFQNSLGIELAGIFSGPYESKPAPIFILCHGHLSHKNSKTFLALKEKLTQHNISAFRFDFSGHGKSKGKLQDFKCTKALDDVQSAVNFLKNMGYIKIGLVGSSLGGYASVIAAGKTPEIFALALKTPALDYSHWKQRMIRDFGKNWGLEKKILFKTSSAECELNNEQLDNFVKDAMQYDTFAEAKNIHAKTYIVHGANDEIAPPELSKKISQIIPSCTCEIIEGADHEYTSPGTFDKMIDTLTKFIIQSTLTKI